MTDPDDGQADDDEPVLAEAVARLAEAVNDLAAAIRGDRDPTIRSEIY